MDRSPRPRIFVSSTIHDFRDLRSALRYWLQELGFDVALSEFTDFPRRPDDATFDSCFQAIDDSDYYVLMIGALVGSEYEPGVSVTRAEFRRALARARDGTLKLALFVRTDIKSKLRERRAASNSLRGAGIAPGEVASSLEQPDEIQSFIDEVEAAGPPGPDPDSIGSTWLYEFSSFRELVDALRQMFRITGSIRRQALLANLKLEIERNLARVCTNRRGIPSPQHVLLEQLRGEVELTAENFQQDFKLRYDRAIRLGMFFLGGYSTVPLSTVALGDCIHSGEFLEYDPIAGEMQAGPMQQRLLELEESISQMASRAQWLDAQRQEAARVVAQLANRNSTIVVPGPLLAATFALFDTTENVLRLLVALHRSVTNPEIGVRDVPLQPLSPLAGQEAGLKAERASLDEVRAWLADPVVSQSFLHEQMDQRLSEEDIRAAHERFPYLREIFDKQVDRIAEAFFRGDEVFGFRWSPEAGLTKVEDGDESP